MKRSNKTKGTSSVVKKQEAFVIELTLANAQYELKFSG